LVEGGYHASIVQDVPPGRDGYKYCLLDLHNNAHLQARDGFKNCL
jgi:hypothetical protein